MYIFRNLGFKQFLPHLADAIDTKTPGAFQRLLHQAFAFWALCQSDNSLGYRLYIEGLDQKSAFHSSTIQLATG